MAALCSGTPARRRRAAAPSRAQGWRAAADALIDGTTAPALADSSRRLTAERTQNPLIRDDFEEHAKRCERIAERIARCDSQDCAGQRHSRAHPRAVSAALLTNFFTLTHELDCRFGGVSSEGLARARYRPVWHIAC